MGNGVCKVVARWCVCQTRCNQQHANSAAVMHPTTVAVGADTRHLYHQHAQSAAERFRCQPWFSMLVKLSESVTQTALDSRCKLHWSAIALFSHCSAQIEVTVTSVSDNSLWTLLLKPSTQLSHSINTYAQQLLTAVATQDDITAYGKCCQT